MAEAASTIAMNECVCQKCGAGLTKPCRTASGRLVRSVAGHVHSERLAQLTQLQIERTKVKITTAREFIDGLIEAHRGSKVLK